MKTNKDAASDAVQGREYFPADESHLIASKFVAQTFRIDVMPPPQKRGSSQRHPVVYVTDGNAVFDMFKGICRIMQSGGREWPPFFLVSIGYPVDSPAGGELLRGRDLSFPGFPDYFTGLEWPWEGVVSPEGKKKIGGAEDFQRFIAEELIPLIDGKYRTVVGDRVYFGHSAGGGFGLFTLLTRSDLFRRYIISSPTLTYHGETPSGERYENHDFMLERFREFASSGKTLDGVRLHMSVGGKEELDPLVANWRFTSSFFRMVALMKARPVQGLELTTEVLVEHSHLSAWPCAFINGIRAVLMPS